MQSFSYKTLDRGGIPAWDASHLYGLSATVVRYLEPSTPWANAVGPFTMPLA
jgi:hypothetical protein